MPGVVNAGGWRPARVTAVATLALSIGLAAAAPGAVSGALDRSAASAAPFSWLVPAPAPAGWKKLTLASGQAVLWYPPSMSAGKSDPGSATAERQSPSGAFLAYLNATPQQGSEGLSNFAALRLSHLRGESSSSIVEVAQASNLRFRGATGSCVIDVYKTRIKHISFREIACFVKGGGPGTVIVASAPPAEWATAIGAQLEQAVAVYQSR